MQERDAYRIALLNASPGDEQSFHEGWLSAIVWQTEVLVDALASAGLHGNSTQTVLQEPQAAVTAKCPYSICGWVTYTHEAPLDLQRLHLEHAHPLPPPIVMPEPPIDVPIPHQHMYVDGQCVGCGHDEPAHTSVDGVLCDECKMTAICACSDILCSHHNPECSLYLPGVEP